MPNAFVNAVAKQSGKSVEEVENEWKKWDDVAKKEKIPEYEIYGFIVNKVKEKFHYVPKHETEKPLKKAFKH